MVADRTWLLDYHGFSYRCRMTQHPDPQTDPVLLLGGALMDMSGWRAVETHLTTATTVITADLPGYGAADPLPPNYDLAFQVGAIAPMLKAIDVSRINLVGTSAGGMMAAMFVRAEPSLAAHGMLFGPPPLTSSPGTVAARATQAWTKGFLTDLTGGRVNEMGRHLKAGVNQDSTCLVRNRDFVLSVLDRQCRQLVRDPHIKNTLRRIHKSDADEFTASADLDTSPKLLFAVGEHDIMTPPDLVRKMATEWPGAYFATITEADHFVHLERPAEVADLILRFCHDEPLDNLDYLGLVEQP